MRNLSLRKKIYIAIGVAAAIWSVVGGVALASTFIRVTDNAGQVSITNGSYDRAVSCRQDECFIFGGGVGSAIIYANQLFRYVPSTDTWSIASTSTIDGGGVSERSFGGNDDFMAMLAIPSGGLSSGCILQIVNLNTFVWTNANYPSNPELSTRCVGGSAGTVAGNYFYFTAAGSGQTFFFRILLSNPTSFETLMDWPLTCGGGGNNLDNILVWDEHVNELVLFQTHDGCISTYDIDSGVWDDRGMIFTPCISLGYCVPTLGFFDIDDGVSAGILNTVTDTIQLYSYNPNTMLMSATGSLTDADLDYAPLNGIDGCCLRAGWWIDANTNSTNVLMGSTTGITASLPANRWWLFTGNQVPITPLDRNFDTWTENFLASIGMNSPIGRLLVGSIFGIALFFVLTIKGVPWIISLGVTGFSVTTLTAVTIFDPSILLGLIAIVGLGIMALLFALIVGRGNTDG